MNLVRRLWERFCAVRFVVVGAWNTVFSYLVFLVLYRAIGGGWGDVVVQMSTAVAGITSAYVLHRMLTYRSHGVWWREYVRFYMVYGAQATLQAGCFFVVSTWLGFDGRIVQLSLTLAFTALSYWLHKNYSFGVRAAEGSPCRLRRGNDATCDSRRKGNQ